jgi:predicted DNA-binding transcriptional regulator YafY
MSKSVLLLQMMDLLRERPGLTIGQLACELGRSERTVYRYLESLSTELHVPVYCRQGAYFLTDRSVASKLDLSPKEVLAVRLALTSGSINKSGPFAEHALSAWRKVETAITGDDLAAVQNAVKKHSIFTPALSEGDPPADITNCLTNAVEQNRRVDVVYRSHQSGDTKALTIDPYALVFRRHNWYLIAYSHSHNRTVQLKLVRVMNASETGETFQTPSDFSVDSFYAKSWEMWTGGDEQLIRVKFSPRVASIIKESKRHATQELENTPDGGVIMSVKVAGTVEIGFWILKWGADAEVLEPLELRTSIEETARKMSEVYSRSAAGVPRDIYKTLPDDL